MTLTDLLALVGAATGCASLGWNVFTWWHAGARLRVQAAPNIVTTDDIEKRLVLVTVTNIGTAPTTLTSLVLRRTTWPRFLWRPREGTAYFIPNPNPQARLPRMLSPGEQWLAMVNQADVVSSARQQGWKAMRVAVFHSARERPSWSDVDLARCDEEPRPQ